MGFIKHKEGDTQVMCSGIRSNGQPCMHEDARPAGEKVWYCSNHRNQDPRLAKANA